MEILKRNWKQALWRGFQKYCPACGDAKMFSTYLGVVATCPHCNEALHHQRADDAPPYFSIMIVGHTIIPLLLLVEKLWRPELWIHFALWLPLTLAMTLWLLPKTKGATVGLQWAMRMHGFAGETNISDSPVRP